MALFAAASGWVAGLALAQWSQFPLRLLPLLLVPPALGLLLARRRRPILLGALTLLGLVAALARVAGASLLPQPPPADAYIGQEAILIGTVSGEPVPRGVLLRVHVDLEQVEAGGGTREVRGGAVAWLEPGAAGSLRGGDRLALAGRLEAPPSFPDFDYRASLLRRGITVALYQPRIEVLGRARGPSLWLSRAREALAGSLNRGLPEPQAGLARALLLGQRDGLTPSIQEEWRRAGTVHILSISGLHIGVLLGVALAAAAAILGRRRHLYLALPFAGIWAYAVLAGLAPPVQRAAAMGSLYILSIALGRQSSGGLALIVAASVLAGIEPRVLGEASFQLSFAAMAGLVYLGPPLQQALTRALGGADSGGGPWAPVASGVAASLGATAAILPLLAYHFGMTSLVGVPATLLALPVLPVQLVTTALAALAGLLSPAAGQAAGWVAWPWLTCLLVLSAFFARLPLAAVPLGPWSATAVVAAYAGMAALLWRPLLGRPAGLLGPVALAPAVSSARAGLALGLSGLGLLLLLDAALWGALLSAPDARLLRVSVLDVGQGDAILIQAPGGRRVLVDGGPDPRLLEERLAQELPWWSRRLDMVVLTHPHADHMGGLPDLLGRRAVGMVMELDFTPDASLSARWREALADAGTPVARAVAGTRVGLGGGAWLEVLHPPERALSGTDSDVDDNSVVLRLSYGRASFLLEGDLFASGESYLLSRGAGTLQATVLKVSHHGTARASTGAFLEAVSPATAVVSVGAENAYGHPSEGALRRLRAHLGEGRLFRTDLDGTVRLATDGERLWAEAAARRR